MRRENPWDGSAKGATGGRVVGDSPVWAFGERGRGGDWGAGLTCRTVRSSEPSMEAAMLSAAQVKPPQLY